MIFCPLGLLWFSGKNLPRELVKYEDGRDVSTEAAEPANQSPERFDMTRWSVVLSCADSGIESVAARDALSKLCETYWRPILAYIGRRGYSTHDAEDLADFFAALIQGPLLQRADPERGRFRSLLLKALGDFLGHAREKRDAAKRGGGVKLVSWDDWMAEAPSQLSIPGANDQFLLSGATVRSAVGCDRSRTSA